MPFPSPSLAGLRLRRMPITVLTNTWLPSGPNTAGAAADLGGGDGSWTNPSNAAGGDDGTLAVWTVP